MSITMLIGAGLTAYGSYGIIKELVYNNSKLQFKHILTASFVTHGLFHEKEKIRIERLERRDYGFYAEILLPSGITVQDLEQNLPAIEQDTASKIRFRHLKGRLCSLDFGRIGLDDLILYENAPKSGLKIPLATHFGWKYLDFQDGSSCHLIGGGATRMGKTCLQLLIATHLYVQSKGNVRLVISSAKTADYYMFRKLPNVSLVTPDQTLFALKEVIAEYEQRRQIIDELGNVNDAVTLAKKYPDKRFTPVFVIVDEVGVFGKSNDKAVNEYNLAVQEALTEIAERAGYVDIHLIIFSQRPDARDVLNPRIKSNMLTKMSFTTANEADSRITLGMEGAEKLGGIKGRAILIDGLPEIVQVPYISNEVAERLLKPYCKEVEVGGNVDETRSTDSEVASPLPSFVKGSVGDIGLPGDIAAMGDDQSDYEAFRSGRSRHNHSKTKRSMLSLHAKSRSDPHRIKQSKALSRHR